MTNLEKYVLLLNPANNEILEQNTTGTTSRRKNEPRRPTNRRQNVEREISVCETLSKNIYPRYGRNRNDEFRLLLINKPKIDYCSDSLI